MRRPRLSLILFLSLMASAFAAQAQPQELVVSVADHTWPEGDGETAAHVTIRLSAPHSRDINISYISIMASSWPPPWDPRYNPYANIHFDTISRVIPAGQTELQVPVEIEGNDSYQSRSKAWSCSFAWNNGLPPESADAIYGSVWFDFTLTEDDPIPLVTVPEDMSITEGTLAPPEGPWSVFPLDFAASAPVSGYLEIHLVDETAKLIEDYDLQHPTAYLFFENNPALSVPFLLTSDGTVEGDETFVVELTPFDMELTRTRVRVTIINDDVPPPAISVTDTVWPEGDGNTEGHVTFTLSHAFPRDIHVDADLAPPPPQERDRGWNLVELEPGWHVIPAGATELQLKFFITGNDSHQSADKIWPGAAHFWDDALVVSDSLSFSITLTEDDPIAVVTAADISIVEGHGGQTPAFLTLTATAPVTGEVSLRLVAETASEYSDYDPVLCCNNPARFNNAPSVTIPFFIWGDMLPEGDETLAFELFDPFDLQLERTRVRVTIVDDDTPLTQALFSPHDLTLYSGESANVRVQLSPSSDHDELLTLWPSNATLSVSPSLLIAPGGTSTFDVVAMNPGIGAVQCSGQRIQCDGVPITVLAPTVQRISPDHGSKAGGLEVSIYGEGFSAACTVSFGEMPAQQTTFVSREMLLATTPSHDIGEVNVNLTCGSVALALDDAFRFEEPVVPRRRSVRH